MVVAVVPPALRWLARWLNCETMPWQWFIPNWTPAGPMSSWWKWPMWCWPLSPLRLQEFAARALRERGVELRLKTSVQSVTPEGVQLGSGEFIPAGIMVYYGRHCSERGWQLGSTAGTGWPHHG